MITTLRDVFVGLSLVLVTCLCLIHEADSRGSGRPTPMRPQLGQVRPGWPPHGLRRFRPSRPLPAISPRPGWPRPRPGQGKPKNRRDPGDAYVSVKDFYFNCHPDGCDPDKTEDVNNGCADVCTKNSCLATARANGLADTDCTLGDDDKCFNDACVKIFVENMKKNPMTGFGSGNPFNLLALLGFG